MSKPIVDQGADADILPPPIDDVEPAPTTQDAPPAFYKPTDESPGEAPSIVRGNDEREAVVDEAVARYREMRDEQNRELREQQGEDHAQEAESVDGEPSAGPKVKLKVHGKEVERPLSEVIAAAQKYEASDERLDEAKRILAEAKAERERAGQEPRGHQRHQPATPPDEERREKLLAIAERIQVGDTEEGAEALAELLGDQQDLDRRVDARLAERAAVQEIDGALQRFGQNFPDVVKSPYLATAGVMALEQEITKDMVKIGVDPKLIAPLRGQTQALALAHRQLRAIGHKNLRSYDQLLDATGATMAKEFNVRPATVQSRIDRKRAMGPQPRAMGARSVSNQGGSRPKTKAEIVADVRRQRGFAPDR